MDIIPNHSHGLEQVSSCADVTLRRSKQTGRREVTYDCNRRQHGCSVLRHALRAEERPIRCPHEVPHCSCIRFSGKCQVPEDWCAGVHLLVLQRAKTLAEFLIVLLLERGQALVCIATEEIIPCFRADHVIGDELMEVIDTQELSHVGHG